MRALVADALAHAGFAVTAVPSSREAIDGFAAADPDVLVTDVDLGGRPNGIELAHILQARAPHLAVVFLTNYPGAASLPGMLPAGATFVVKSALDSVEALVSVVDDALMGEEAVVAHGSGPLRCLTRAQLDILRLMAQGCSNAEIARRRRTSLRSVEKMISRTFDALSLAHDAAVNPRVAAVSLYIDAFGVARDEPPRPA